jgi:pimeloyl-ACP methyl ester carboxylesterase
MDLYVEDRGGDRVPILLIHPAGAIASTWGPVVDELATRGRLITYDRRGYGRTGGDVAGSIARHTRDAADLLDVLHCAPAVVFGISVAATIAIDLAVRRPDLVRAVVAHESPWRVTRQLPTPRQIRALATVQWRSARGRHAEAVEAFLRFAYSYRDGGSAWDRFPDEWRQVARENARPSLDDFRIAVGEYPTRRDLASIETPVVCTVGDRSNEPLRRVARALTRVIPGSTLRSVPNAGHALAFDAPSEMVGVIEQTIAAT